MLDKGFTIWMVSLASRPEEFKTVRKRHFTMLGTWAESSMGFDLLKKMYMVAQLTL